MTRTAERTPGLRILLVEDMPLDAMLCEAELRRGGLAFSACRVQTRNAFEQALDGFEPTLIISDFTLPGFDGFTALAIARARAPETPFIFLSGTIGEERAVEAMKQGATDYVLKDHLGRLLPVVRRALQERTEHIALREAEDQRRTHEQKIAKLLRVRAVLGGINGAMVRIRDEDTLYQEACRIAVREGGFKSAWVGKLAPETLDLTIIARCGGHAEDAAWLHDASQIGGSLPDMVARSGKVAISNDLRCGQGLLTAPEHETRAYRSMAVLPLKPEDHVTGMIALYSGEEDFFDDEEVRLLEELAGNISFALAYMAKAAKLDYLAYYDALTGLANRKLFHDRLTQMIARAAAEATGIVVVIIDLQQFRRVIETLGTSAGDAILRQTARRLEGVSGDLGTAARLTADQFAIALPDSGRTGEGVYLRLEHVREIFEAPFEVDAETLRVQARTGVAVYPLDGPAADVLLANAEAALKAAKRSGESYAFYAPEMNARVAEMLRLENELRIAVREEQFILFYQPRISLATGARVGLEALIRWRHPRLGLVPPADFIPLLEETGLILDVGRWALKQAAADAVRWRALGGDPPSIGVNVSAIQLRQKGFVDDVMAAIAAGGGAPGSIEIELTESMLMSDVETNVRKLRDLRAAGIRIAIDDFGTGYSSLSYLVRLPIDTLKIDRAFVAPMCACPMHLAIVTTVISLARALDLRVVAEGVETQEQAKLLTLLRCEEAQGFLYSRPLPFEQVEAASSLASDEDRNA
ncbi:MAG: hypothetical protein JWO70_2601 [Betaproteobacteria bacterium]|nr:hypothetical protein [Betaproteobacteria bacterium]